MKRYLSALARRLAPPAPTPAVPHQQGPQPPARLFPGIGKHHNIMDVGNFIAAMSSAEFANANFSQARPFREKNQMYPWAMSQTRGDGLVLEFGVASGGTVNQLADLHKGPVHGFDVFTGLPETWRPGFPKGAFAQENLPKVRKNVELVVGLFEDTLPGFVAKHPGRVKLLHVDCDIYSGTVTIFTELEDRIDDDTIIVFDEYLNFPGWERDEHRAFMEFCDRTGRTPEYLAFVPASEQVVARARRTSGAPAPTVRTTPAPHTTLRHVKHATFAELEAAGHRIERFDDGAKPLDIQPRKMRACPKNWATKQALIQAEAAILPHATLFHEGSVLTADGLFNHDAQTFNIHPWTTRHHRAVLRHIDEDTGDCLIRPYPRKTQIAGRCFSLLSNTTHNYGHFIHDVLSRIHYEDLGLIAPGRETLIAPRFKFPMQQALFEHVFRGYDVITPPDGTALEVEELVTPANLCDSLTFNPAGVAAVAARLRTALAGYADPGTVHKVCVSRSDGKASGGRSFANMDAYETRLAQRGYRVVAASDLSLDDQFALWCNTGDIVGIHGAGMMNMIMMPETSRYTEITPHPRGPFYTARCAMAAGHDVAGYTADAGPEGQSQIDLARLEAILDA
ncbi:MAG: glycosyltransferase 61 family protein [Pseudomonadota bacterium]